MLLLAAIAVASCGGDAVPATDARDVPPARLPGDSALPAPLPADHTETLQPGGTTRTAPDPGTGVSDAAASAADTRPATPAAGRPPGQQQPAEPEDPTAAAAAAVDTEAILRRASSAYANIRSLSADFVMNREIPALRQTITSRGTLYQRSPDRIALRFSDPDGDLILGDGEYFWVYYPSVNPDQYMRQPAAAADRSGVDLQAQFVGNPVDRFDATLHGTETVAGRQAHVLTLVPRQRAEYRSLKVWLDGRDSLARRFEIVEHNGTMRRFDLDNIQTNITIPDATFRFTPPPGARNIAPG
jgi:outer membrane lipoprotein-sorting protein